MSDFLVGVVRVEESWVTPKGDVEVDLPDHVMRSLPLQTELTLYYPVDHPEPLQVGEVYEVYIRKVSP